jgi:cyanophycin synthetase
LQSCGVPIPEGRLVNSLDDAWEAAEDIGLPVVVKPRDGNHGRGVSTNLTTRADVEAAYRLALEETGEVIVERFILGNEHRLLVVGGKLVAAARGEEAEVIGDGVSNITKLIDDQLNSDPRRGTTENCPLNLIRLDDDPAVRLELERQGFHANSIAPDGHKILIQRNGNVALDVTDLVHPDVAAIASLAARIIGLDIAGVDLVCKDISLPLSEQRGAIVEVNAGPGLLMHLKHANGGPRPVGRAIVEHLFPEGDDGRVPVVGVTGSFGKTTVCHLIARLLSLSGKYTGLACSDGLYLDRRQVQKGDCATWEAANRILLNRAIEAAVFENGSDAILGEGLAYDRCQVGVVTNVTIERHTGRFYIETPEQVFNVLRTQIDLVLPKGAAVLNAKEPMLVEMAALCDGEVIYFALDPELPAIAEHREQGKRAVIVRHEQIMLASGNDEVPLANLKDIPLSEGGRAKPQVENVLAAIGAAWALDISPDVMRTGIETFFVE